MYMYYIHISNDTEEILIEQVFALDATIEIGSLPLIDGQSKDGAG